jgi:hypothetical protein
LNARLNASDFNFSYDVVTVEYKQVIGHGSIAPDLTPPPPPPSGPVFTNEPLPNATQCAYYNNVSTGFQLSALPSGSTFSGTVPDGLFLTTTGKITGVAVTKGLQTFNITATDPITFTTSQLLSTITVASDGSGFAKSVNDLGVWTEDTVAEGGGATHISNVQGGSGICIMKFPAGWATGTERVWHLNSLGKCDLKLPYTLNWSLSLALWQDAIPGAQNSLTNNMQLRIANVIVYSNPGYPGYYQNVDASGSLVINSASPGGLNNCNFDVQIGTGGAIPGPASAVALLSCWPSVQPN